MEAQEQQEITLLQEMGTLAGKLLKFWGENKGPWRFGRKQHPWPMPGWKKDIYLKAIQTELERN
jgi:hypothetical protein